MDKLKFMMDALCSSDSAISNEIAQDIAEAVSWIAERSEEQCMSAREETVAWIESMVQEAAASGLTSS